MTSESELTGMSDVSLQSLHIRGTLVFLLCAITYGIICFLVSVLPCPPIGFWLSFVDFVKNKKDSDMSDMTCSFVLLMASASIGVYVVCRMINHHGPTIENLITYAMDDGSHVLTGKEYDDGSHVLTEKEYDCKAAHDVGKVLVALKNKRVIVTRAAFMVFQIVMYLMGCLAGVQFEGGLSPDLGLGFVAFSSILSVTIFKLFTASHQYCLTMAKWVISHSIVIQILTLSYWDPSQAPHIVQLCIGASPIIVAVFAMMDPVEKLYAIDYAENQISYLDKEHKLMTESCLSRQDDIEKGERA